MRKFTMILSLLVAMCTTAMAGNLVGSTTDTPVYFKMKNANGAYVKANAVNGDQASAGKFAFYAVEGVENAYYIYSVDAGKWFNYEKAGSYANQKAFISLSDEKVNYFNFAECSKDGNAGYQIAPYNTTGVAAKYLNWFQGTDNSSTLGLWQEGGGTDAGSCFILEEYVSVQEVESEPLTTEYYYQIVNRKSGKYLSTSGERAAMADNAESDKELWALVESGDKYMLKNKAGDFIKHNTVANQCWFVSTSGSLFTIAIQQKATTIPTPAYYYISYDTNDEYACMHEAGWPQAERVVKWEAAAENSQWDFVLTEIETETVELYNVTYNFLLDGVTVATQTETVTKGDAYPEFNVPNVRLGIVPVDAKPEGTVTANTTVNIALAIDNTLVPFEFVESGTPTVWYYTQMHSNKRSFIDNNLAWNADALTTSFTAAEADAYSWGFVGNVVDGFKMVNKATGEAIKSTGGDNENVTMVELDNATAFVAMPTGENVANGFCMMNSESNSYMNAHDGSVKHWTDNDAGSTIMLTEREEFNITVSDVRYATLYLDYNAYIPAGVEVYYVAAINEKGNAKMTQVVGAAIPANQGFILKNAGEYTFVKAIVAGTDVAAIETNLLKGSVEETTIGENCYVLANGDNGLGFYGVVEGVSGANKAYLEVPAADGSAAFYGFLFEGTTGVENVEVENGVQVIFDLTGRRIDAINAAGIYIVNGKKVLVK